MVATGADMESGLVIAHHGSEVEIMPLPDTSSKQVLRCKLRANLPGIVCGDHVAWRQTGDTAVVEALEPRNSVIVRPRPHSTAKPIAANIDLIILVLSPQPEPIANLIDRYLVAAENTGVPVVLLINKCDLLDSGGLDASIVAEIETLASLYSNLGYPVYYFSSTSPDAMHKPLRAALDAKPFDPASVLQNRTAILVGQSGVGKSSIINAVCQQEIAATGDISAANTRGRHTTTNARFYFLQGSGLEQASALIDSPGIREFALWHLSEQDIIAGMPEFRALAGQCRFRDCEHGISDGCAIQAAIDSGDIHPSRVASYRHILATDKDSA